MWVSELDRAESHVPSQALQAYGEWAPAKGSSFRKNFSMVAQFYASVRRLFNSTQTPQQQLGLPSHHHGKQHSEKYYSCVGGIAHETCVLRTQRTLVEDRQVCIGLL